MPAEEEAGMPHYQNFFSSSAKPVRPSRAGVEIRAARLGWLPSELGIVFPNSLQEVKR